MSDRRAPPVGNGYRIRRGGRSRIVALAALGMFAAGPADAGPPEAASAVVVIGRLPPDGALAAAGGQVPSHWRLERLAPQAVAPPPDLGPEIDSVARAYREADFLRCLAQTEAGLEGDELLRLGQHAEAARAGTLAAACALGSSDEQGARAMLRRLSARELVDREVLRQTTPGFQRIADEERAAAHRRGSVAVEVRTEPEGARVLVNGVARCPASPCRVHLLRGEHHLVADKLGYRRRVVMPVADADATVRVVLEPASADETRQQLTAMLAAGADPSATEISRAVASAFGVGQLVLVWARQWQVHAAAYRAGCGAQTHVAFDGPQATPRAVAAALHGWRVATPPARTRRWLPAATRELLFWGAATAVTLGAAATAFIRQRYRGVRRGVALLR
jgi:hypothetical protein